MQKGTRQNTKRRTCAKVTDDKSGILEWIFSNKSKANPGDPLVTLGDNILIGLATRLRDYYLNRCASLVSVATESGLIRVLEHPKQ
ncbi:unnamed protein product [Callosobruchus maculatus]|uniref:Uncharacterized protein n=1 Tax=Callosobruchus maculatus TaxID=64391 RepID=A0A653CQE6_CALMS|nr:unnamed protein product [Callosobruchus maculatus]